MLVLFRPGKIAMQRHLQNFKAKFGPRNIRSFILSLRRNVMQRKCAKCWNALDCNEAVTVTQPYKSQQ